MWADKCVFYLILSCCLVGSCSARKRRPPVFMEQKLMNDLISKRNYKVHTRPANDSETVKVKFGLGLIQIKHVDEVHQIIQTTALIRQTWIDTTMKWDPERYGGISVTHVPIKHFWKPDIILYNNGDSKWNPYSMIHSPEGVVSSDGSVLLITPVEMRSLCQMNFTNYPHDTQTCKLKFGSWTYDGFKMDLDFYDGLESVDLNDYIESLDWEILAHPASKIVKYYPCCREPYIDLTFTLKLSRKHSGHHLHTLMLPSVVLAMLIPVIFLIPAGSTEKTSLGVGIILGLVLLSIMMEQMVPNHGKQSYSSLTLYNLLCIKLTAVSLVCAALVNGIWRQPGTFPKIIRKILNVIGYTVCACGPGYRPKRVENAGTSTEGASKWLTDWQLLSVIIDRLLLITFIVLISIVTFVMSDVTDFFIDQ